jgi:hypothetical protein
MVKAAPISDSSADLLLCFEILGSVVDFPVRVRLNFRS